MEMYLLLFYEFFKTGLLAVGGGMATIPFLKEISATRGWFSLSELTDFIAVSESTPGPIGINMATFAGFRTGGILGGIMATLSLVLPSFIVAVIISNFLKKFRQSGLVETVFEHIRPATAGLISGAIFEVFVISLFDVSTLKSTGSILGSLNIPAVIIYILTVITHFKFRKIHPTVFIAAGAAAGIIFRL